MSTARNARVQIMGKTQSCKSERIIRVTIAPPRRASRARGEALASRWGLLGGCACASAGCWCQRRGGLLSLNGWRGHERAPSPPCPALPVTPVHLLSQHNPMTRARPLLCGALIRAHRAVLTCTGHTALSSLKGKWILLGAVKHFWCAECPTGILNGYIFAPAGRKERLPHVRTHTTLTTQNFLSKHTKARGGPTFGQKQKYIYL